MTIQQAIDSNRANNILNTLNELEGMQLLFALAQVEQVAKERKNGLWLDIATDKRKQLDSRRSN